MASLYYVSLLKSGFYNNVSAKDRLQNINLNQLNLKLNVTCDKDEKITTKFELSNIKKN